MKITSTYKIGIKGTDVVFTLRAPTVDEFNTYYRSRTGDDVVASRVSLFNELLQTVENLEDDKGVITEKEADRIPAKWKVEAIFELFDKNEVELKN